MTSPFCTHDEITTMVYRFYDDIRSDPELGPIFNAHIDNWDIHLDTMVKFWSSLLLGTASFRGNPMPKHAALPDLDASLFHRWLQLFDHTTQTLDNPLLAERAHDFARRIARRLWQGYQMYHRPGHPPQDLFQAYPTHLSTTGSHSS
ncbi:MAG TPA: group III truncated hemoglobin [Burkholderiaceae bacterium]|nr:group III truncated hemoglobin [Burkholderiaceae bacterium]